MRAQSALATLNGLAVVLCREAGYTNGTAGVGDTTLAGLGYRPAGNAPKLTSLRCNGTEAALDECRFSYAPPLPFSPYFEYVPREGSISYYQGPFLPLLFCPDAFNSTEPAGGLELPPRLGAGLELCGVARHDGLVCVMFGGPVEWGVSGGSRTGLEHMLHPCTLALVPEGTVGAAGKVEPAACAAAPVMTAAGWSLPTAHGCR